MDRLTARDRELADLEQRLRQELTLENVGAQLRELAARMNRDQLRTELQERFDA